MKKKIIGALLIVLGIFPNVYGQKFLKQTLKELGGASRTVQVPSTISETILRRAAVARPVETPRRVSFKQQCQVALQMRPLLFKSSRWDEPLKQGIDHTDVYAGVRFRGNLTKLSPQQWQQALAQYQQTMEAMKALSSYVDCHIFYLGGFGEKIEPKQIRQALMDISRVQGLVRKAQISLGTNKVLEEADLYLRNAHGFYMMLSTGQYFEIDMHKRDAIVRSDGHIYIQKEFALDSGESLKDKIPSMEWYKPFTWFNRHVQEILPERLQVAVLQDDVVVIQDIKSMREKANLKNWKIDYYDDPEYFLNQVSYAQYDLILTDILMQNGGGRYLTRQLRSRGYEGSILILSGFDVTQGGELFFADGADGMIDVYTPRSVAGADWLWTRLNHYYWLKQKHGWKH